MKKLLFTFAICLIALFTKAQQETQAQLEAFNTYTNNMNMHVDESFKLKNYNAAVDTINVWFSHFDQLSKEFKADVKPYASGFYYNLACACSRLGKKAEAIAALEKSIDGGYHDYAHIQIDNDLDNIRNEQKFRDDVAKLHDDYDFGYILQKSGAYNNKKDDLPAFTYQSSSAPELVSLKNKYNLDSVAGNGDEISRIKGLLLWVHNKVKHDGNSSNPLSRNAIDLIAVCQKENRGVNCRMMSTILRDVYQAEGFDTRIVTCLPKDKNDNDCHVITVVWSKSLNKWIWMDPTFNAYVTDKKGNLLNIQEVRERMMSGSDDMVLNSDANWNNQQKETQDQYLGYYMRKNLYWLQCLTKNEWDAETRKPGMASLNYVDLYPGTYTRLSAPKVTEGNTVEYATNNPDQFWAAPKDAVQ